MWYEYVRSQAIISNFSVSQIPTGVSAREALENVHLRGYSHTELTRDVIRPGGKVRRV